MGTIPGAGVLDKAVLVLDALEGGPLLLSDLVEATGLPRATAHRLAVALEQHLLVERDAGGRFGLGPRFVGFALPVLARPALEQLRDQSGESVQLYVRRGDQRLCVAALESNQGLRTIVAVGTFLPLDAGSAGRVLGGEPVSAGGWIESVEERQRGVASVSAPVYDRGGRPLAAVSISGPLERTTRSPGLRFGDSVVASARILARVIEDRRGDS